MTAYLYPISLAAFSVLVLALERLFPWRKGQAQWRPALWSDLIHLVFNGHFLGIVLSGIASTWILPPVDRWLGSQGLMDQVYRNAAAAWPLWVQIPVALVAVDFVQWCVHNLLHRVPFFWELHKAHHSVKDGEMDWIVSFRFSWLEVMVYKSVLYLPLVFLGFRWEALLVHAIFGTLIGHFNHANLDISWGPLRYVLNSPRMHIWHHDVEGDEKTTVNFGIIFSTWDWLFGTAKMPDHPPAHIGFKGDDAFPGDFFGQQIWPLQKWLPAVHSRLAWSAAGLAALALGWYLHAPRTAAVNTPMLGERAAASQPSSSATPAADAYAGSPAEAQAAVARFGETAKQEGYAHPEAMVSVPELARALGAESLVVVDVRPRARFQVGHIPGARRLDRGDYSIAKPMPGMSREAPALLSMLGQLGVTAQSTVVLYGDGGPEPYRLWWTLRERVGLQTRVLDGGLQGWKAAGHRVAGGDGTRPVAADMSAAPQTPSGPASRTWEDVRAFLGAHPGTQLLDTRSRAEFDGSEQHPKAARAGRIPGALHLDWVEVLRDKERDHRLRPAATLRRLLAGVGIDADTPVLTYCQSGTRSAGVFYALYQVGHPGPMQNYDGSWAEYSRLDLPLARGAGREDRSSSAAR